MPKKICSVHELLFDLRKAVFTVRVVHRVGSVIIKDRFDITRNGPDRVSGPFHGLQRPLFFPVWYLASRERVSASALALG